MITLAIRFDDPSPTSDQAIEKAFIDALARWRLRATVAVIPHCLVDGESIPHDRERAAHIITALREGLVEVALHGHSHAQRSKTPKGASSEFWGLAAELQTDLMTQGLERLQSIFGKVVTGFVPPWNTFDAATLAAAHRLALRYVSAGWEGPKGLMLLPRTAWLAELPRAVHEARGFHKAHCVIVAVVHHYDFAESGEPNAKLSRDRLDSLFRWISAQSDVRIETLSEVASRVTPSATLRGITLRRLRDLMPWRFRRMVPAESIVLGPPWHLLRRAPSFEAPATVD